MPAIRKSSADFPRLTSVLLTTALLLIGANASPVMAQSAVNDDLFAFPPRTPERLIRAAILADQLDRPLLAQQYLATFLDNQPGKVTLQTLRKKIGITAFLKLSATERLQPESTKVLSLVNSANPYPKLSPSVIQDLVQSLGESPKTTTDASLQLISAGADAVGPLLNADITSVSGNIADKLLSRYPRRFQDGLLSTLPESESGLQTRILNYLAKTADPDVSPQILPLQYSDDPQVANAASNALKQLKAFAWIGISKAEASNVLSEQSFASLQAASQRQLKPMMSATIDGEEAAEGDDFMSTTLDETRQLEAALAFAAQAVALNPSTKSEGTKYAVEAAASAWPATWQTPSLAPVSGTLAERDLDVMTAGIQLALEAKSTAGLLKMLAGLKNTSQIFEAAPLVMQKCLTYRDPRVRLLAAAAASTQGNRPERVSATINSIMDGSRRAEAVVIDPRVGDGSVAAGVLREMGYDVAFERTGRDGFSTATKQLRCELIMVHSNCLQWPLSVTLANLRADYRTSDVPIVIYGHASHEINVATKVNADAGVWFVREPLTDRLTPDSLKLKAVSAPLLSDAERISMIQFALQLTEDQ
ncbi:MAG: hypothetical protein ABJZ55_09055 [Fuerstiella sp.]